MEISWTDHVKNEEVLHNQGGEEYLTYRKRKQAKGIGHILRMNCLLQHITEERWK
jgi:hypothetical protein